MALPSRKFPGAVGGPSVRCTGCLEWFVPSAMRVYPLVSRGTGLLYPGEPFCGEDCYNEYADNPAGAFGRPSPADTERFVRAVTGAP